MQYLTWQQLFDLREQLALTPAQLAEPVLFTLQDGYGDQAAYPVTYWTESSHPSDGTGTLCRTGEALEMLLPGEYERDAEERGADDEAAEPEDTRTLLRTLPLGALRIGFSDLDEDFEEATQWLAQPNPHQPAPVPGRPTSPAHPGTGSLFE